MDGRKNNGGNSTKAKGTDKRKNPYRTVIYDTITADDLGKVLKMLYDKSINKQDVKAAQLLLEYTLVKPKQEFDITTDGQSFNIKDVIRFKE